MNGDRGIVSVLSDLLGEMSALFREEIHLARAEISDKVAVARTALGVIAAGAVLAMASLVILLIAVVGLLLMAQFTLAAAAGIVGGIALVVALVAVYFGVRRLNADNLTPRKTVHQFQRDAQVARREVRFS